MSTNLSAAPHKMSRRRVALAGLVVAFAGFGTFGAAPAQAATRLPRPSVIVVSNVTAHTVSLNIGGSTVKTYDVFANGLRYATATPSSASLALVVTGLPAETSFAIQVEENTNGRVSALSAPVSVRTLSATGVAPPTNLRVISATTAEIRIAWDASATPNTTTTHVFYEITLNGIGNQSTNRTEATVAESLNCYPNPCAGTGPKAGRNVITVTADASLVGFNEFSAPVELVVFI